MVRKRCPCQIDGCAEAAIGQGVIAGSDGCDPQKRAQHRDTICLLAHCATRAEAETRFDALAEGGQPLQRLTPHPPHDDGGMGALVRDKYGCKWILTAPNDHQQ